MDAGGEKRAVNREAKRKLKKGLAVLAGEKRIEKIAGGVRRRKIDAWRISRFLRNGFRRGSSPSDMECFEEPGMHVFFGYYDISPMALSEDRLLAARTPADSGTDPSTRELEVGFYDLNEYPREFHPVGKTRTWCWQQGCRLQWYPNQMQGRSDSVIYNCLVGQGYGCRLADVVTGQTIEQWSHPVYALSPDGKFGYSLDFSRLGRMRPGYGYNLCPDESIAETAPATHGIRRIEMESGKSYLLFSVSDIAKWEPLSSMQDAHHYLNHICVNTDGTRFLFFHIWLKAGRRYTRLITCNADGTKPFMLINEGHVSHYCWKSPDWLLCYSTHAESGQRYHLYQDRTEKRTVFAGESLQEDGHPSFSPDGQRLLTDTYPDQYGDRKLLLFDMVTEQVTLLGRLYSPHTFVGEYRCDLHPRWSPSGRWVIIDSAHKNRRGIYLLNASNA